MKCSPFRVAAAVLGAVALLSTVCSTAHAQPTTDARDLAAKLVNQCAGIHEGEVVLVTGGVRDAKLLDEIALQCRKVGAFPLVTLASEQRDRRYYDEVPAVFDDQPPQIDLLLAKQIHAIISVEYGETPEIFDGISAERVTAVSKAFIPVTDLRLSRNVREVYVGNNIYPTDHAARQNQMSKEALSKLFWNGINVDYNLLQATADRVKLALARGTSMRVTAPNGTDLTFRIQGRPVLASDGIIHEEDRQKGGANCQVFLPAGEVYLAPVPGTAEGKVVVDRQLFRGKEIRGLTLTFKAGRLVDMTAKSGLEPFKAVYDAATEGKDELSFVDVGVNPNVVLPAGSDLDAWMASGMVTVGLGNNYWSGSDNRSTFSSSHFLHGATLTIDQKKVVDAGSLAL